VLVVVDVAVLDRRDVVLFRGVDFLDTVFTAAIELLVLVVFLGGAQRGFFFGVGLFFGEQRLAILLGDLVIVGMDFREGEEAVTVAAEIDERRLQRRFDPRDLG